MKWNVEATFTLFTEIQPDFYRSDVGDSSANDYEDNSSFGSASVEVDGGEIRFWVEAADEDEATVKAEEIISDGGEVEDSNGLTWVVQDVSITVERDEMSMEEALVIVRRLLDRLAADGVLRSEEREAFDVILQDV